MTEEAELPEEHTPLENESAGVRLRTAREEAGLSIDEIAGETRIPQRHLEIIEQGDFASLPARTYAIGFSRSFARAVGLDEKEIAEQVRAELAENDDGGAIPGETFEPGDPARVASRKLAWFSAFAVLLLLVGGFAFFRSYFLPGAGPPALSDPAEQAAQESPDETRPGFAEQATAPSSGPVVFRSKEDGLWVKFYDADGERLMEKQMAQGESYTVPADAQGPQVWTGQPESLEVLIGGTSIGTLSDESEIVRDIPVTADALRARITERSEEPSVASPTGEGTTTSE